MWHTTATLCCMLSSFSFLFCCIFGLETYKNVLRCVVSYHDIFLMLSYLAQNHFNYGHVTIQSTMGREIMVLDSHHRTYFLRRKMIFFRLFSLKYTLGKKTRGKKLENSDLSSSLSVCNAVCISHHTHILGKKGSLPMSKKSLNFLFKTRESEVLQKSFKQDS